MRPHKPKYLHQQNDSWGHCHGSSNVSRDVYIHGLNNYEYMPETLGIPTCPLCSRALVEPTTRHHLIPPSKGGKDTPTVQMHKICQTKVHAVFTETELKNYYHTVERIQEHEDMTKFIKWVRKKDLEFFDNSIKKK